MLSPPPPPTPPKSEQPMQTIIDVYIIIVLKHQPWHIIRKFIVIASDNKYAKTHINNYRRIFSLCCAVRYAACTVPARVCAANSLNSYLPWAAWGLRLISVIIISFLLFCVYCSYKCSWIRLSMDGYSIFIPFSSFFLLIVGLSHYFIEFAFHFHRFHFDSINRNARFSFTHFLLSSGFYWAQWFHLSL